MADDAKADKKAAKRYEKMGREFESIFYTLKPSNKQFYKVALIKGALTGIGGVLGATVGVALLIWILSLFNEVPLIGPFVDSFRETVESQ